jgi:hypothetical protein
MKCAQNGGLILNMRSMIVTKFGIFKGLIVTITLFSGCLPQQYEGKVQLESNQGTRLEAIGLKLDGLIEDYREEYPDSPATFLINKNNESEFVTVSVISVDGARAEKQANEEADRLREFMRTVELKRLDGLKVSLDAQIAEQKEKVENARKRMEANGSEWKK